MSARMMRAAEGNFSTVTDLADALVRNHGFSFRVAHQVVGALVREALESYPFLSERERQAVTVSAHGDFRFRGNDDLRPIRQLPVQVRLVGGEPEAGRASCEALKEEARQRDQLLGMYAEEMRGPHISARQVPADKR